LFIILLNILSLCLVSLPKACDVEIGKVKDQSITLTRLPPTGSLQDETDSISAYLIEVWHSDERS
jgi:hypothetical protein